ncbi:hypothetical protein FOMPIDRAFT_94402 [Fomitopsis schrenkii]|uniref:Uncharacterized protein n=1 Tax=Fomitopsis schrenkii TaxID=2126942 RepID=S8E3P3_FOMSC|nr:hypothetical protein FOMPIDRAFT_94402 [Fomitopsis schrenkii]
MLDGHVKLPAGSGISIVDDEDEKERRLKLTVTPPPPLCTLCGDRQPVQPLVLDVVPNSRSGDRQCKEEGI